MSGGQLALPARDPAPSFPTLGLVTEGDVWSYAVFSPCTRYRYLLGRTWDADAPTMTWCMVNPSTASASEDDATIRKCVGFARRYGCGSIRVVNLAAWRATDVRELHRRFDVDIVGAGNTVILRWALAADQGLRVAGWGRIAVRAKARLRPSLDVVAAASGLWCFGLTTVTPFEPRHPLMLAYDTPLVGLTDGRKFR